jgi:hypothetical protein
LFPLRFEPLRRSNKFPDFGPGQRFDRKKVFHDRLFGASDKRNESFRRDGDGRFYIFPRNDERR